MIKMIKVKIEMSKTLITAKKETLLSLHKQPIATDVIKFQFINALRHALQ